MILLYYARSCSLAFIAWLQDHLLPCPFKYFTGVDCPGCGFQRAVVALLKGNIAQSFSFYPAAIPLLLIFMYGIADGFYKLDTREGIIKKTSFVIAASIILVSYTLKMAHLYWR